MEVSEMRHQIEPFMDEAKIVIRRGDEIIRFTSMKYGFLDDEGTLFIDIPKQECCIK